MEYVFVVKGQLGGAVLDALHPSSVEPRGDATELMLEVEDDAQLYGVLAKLERLAISIVSVEPAESASGDGASSGPANR